MTTFETGPKQESREARTENTREEASRSEQEETGGLSLPPPEAVIRPFDDARAEATTQRELRDIAQQRRQIMNPQQMSVGQLIQRKETAQPVNKTGLPDHLKAGLENLSSMSMDDVKVHHNSPEPSQLQALAYTKGTDIHLAPGQDKHLPHEAWHVVQQKQGRVTPTMQLKDEQVNDDSGLEREADTMGAKAASLNIRRPDEPARETGAPSNASVQKQAVVQRLTGMEAELAIPFYGEIEAKNKHEAGITKTDLGLSQKSIKAIASFLWGGLIYDQVYGVDGTKPNDWFYDISADHASYRKLHKKFIEKLYKKKYIDQEKPDDDMTNLEYRTPPLEERDPKNSRKPGTEGMMSQIATKIQGHAVDASQKAIGTTTQALNDPVTNCYTGVPVDALKRLVDKDASLKSEVDKLKSDIKPTVYFQTTFGALPSEIPALFEKAAEDIKSAAAKNRVNKTQLEWSIAIAKNAVDANQAFLKKFTPGQVKSLQGWMTMMAQYLFGYQLEVTSHKWKVAKRNKLEKVGGTEKNLVPYLVKMHLVDALDALPLKPNPSDAIEGSHWKKLFTDLAKESEKDEYNLVQEFGLESFEGPPHSKTHGEVIEDTPQQWVIDIITKRTFGTDEKAKDIYAFHVGPGKPLSLDAGQGALKPALTIKGEEGIPLEDRKSLAKKRLGRVKPENIKKKIGAEWRLALKLRAGSSGERKEFDELYKLVEGMVADLDKDITRYEPSLAKDVVTKHAEKDPYDITQDLRSLKNIQRAIFHTLSGKVVPKGEFNLAKAKGIADLKDQAFVIAFEKDFAAVQALKDTKDDMEVVQTLNSGVRLIDEFIGGVTQFSIERGKATRDLVFESLAWPLWKDQNWLSKLANRFNEISKEKRLFAKIQAYEKLAGELNEYLAKNDGNRVAKRGIWHYEQDANNSEPFIKIKGGDSESYLEIQTSYRVKTESGEWTRVKTDHDGAYYKFNNSRIGVFKIVNGKRMKLNNAFKWVPDVSKPPKLAPKEKEKKLPRSRTFFGGKKGSGKKRKGATSSHQIALSKKGDRFGKGFGTSIRNLFSRK